MIQRSLCWIEAQVFGGSVLCFGLSLFSRHAGFLNQQARAVLHDIDALLSSVITNWLCMWPVSVVRVRC